ncbi:MAG: hypothetical protein M0P91_09685 [Sulfuricurvum sp.]|jgi:hypothetical protein|uniref:hypothetical protein n=1 Tax=Sulfuricurvum sp. TaxID=2025608 RepID=UPI0025D2EC4F|nr:hypothetical protein [Sulfuricurvum sp.]MCK9373459.1 hypothetical protein [Sulfuricurvum sp.]
MKNDMINVDVAKIYESQQKMMYNNMIYMEQLVKLFGGNAEYLKSITYEINPLTDLGISYQNPKKSIDPKKS